MPTVTKQDLVAEVAERTGCSKVLAAKMVDSLFCAMRENLMDGNRIEIRRFGAWTVKQGLTMATHYILSAIPLLPTSEKKAPVSTR